jgi:aminoglycoside phosphotransferase (APT) family kinase protein
MQPDPEAYLAILRNELLTLTDNLDTETAAGIRLCTDKIVSQLIVRNNDGWQLIQQFETELEALFNEYALDLPISDGGDIFQRRTQLLEAIDKVVTEHPPGKVTGFTDRAALLDEGFRKQFTSLSEAREKQLQNAHYPKPWRLTADRIEAGLPQLLDRWTGARVKQLKRISGIHSKEIYFAHIECDGVAPEHLVIRCDRNENVTRTSVADEFPLLCELHRRGFNIPQPLASTADTDIFGQPVVIMERIVCGSEKLPEQLNDGPQVMSDLAQFLSRLHTTPLEGLGLKDDFRTVNAHNLWLERIESIYQWWRDIAVEPVPIMSYARDWLVDHADTVSDQMVLAHGDFSLRNVLIDNSDRLAAVLDWDMAHLGHPAVDLGYIRATVESVMPWQTFFDIYRSGGGKDISKQQVKFFDVWGFFRNEAFNGTAHRLFLSGETADPFFGTTGIYYYPQFLSSLTRLLLGSRG